MRAVSLIALLLIALATSPGSARAEWITYRDPAGTFSVEFPRAPKITEADATNKAGKPIHKTSYLVNDTDVQLMVMVTQLEGKASRKTLDNAVDSLVSEGFTLVSKQAITLDGHEGWLAIVTDSAGYQYEFRFFVAGELFYQAGCVKPKNPTEVQNAEVRRFANSFRITK